MSQSLRQSELFAGSDWRVIYRAFTNVNFNASDPPSINRALRSYIQTNYPENFNDWIESSEFVAIIDLLSWLAGTLAFRTDLNARESFLETAEARESILRLARFISYNPRRNQPAKGIVKLVEVSTDDDVLDAYGQSLSGIPVQWDNPDDPDWFESFVTVLNSAFISTNPFGVPLKSGVVGAAKTQLYRMNNRMSDLLLGFNAKVSGSSMDFEVVNTDFNDGGGFTEIEPDFDNAFHLTYRSDGNGNSSPQTGFFMMFKQGTLRRETFGLTVPVENRVLDLGATGVNDSDVWVQTVSDSGAVMRNWNKVPAIFNENITYNNFDSSIRDIFSVITRDEDSVSIRFSDGRFGAVPTGNARVWYRTSNGLRYQIRPADINRVKIPINYTNRRGVKKTLTLTFSLQTTVSNSTPRETDEQIKARAPSVYATQNRMVSGEDYNTFPLQSNLAVKLKAVNRVYSGHSRFIDLNDPTGNYQDLNVFADDGIYFSEDYKVYTEIPLSRNATASEIVTSFIQPMLNRSEVGNYVRAKLLEAADVPNSTLTWTPASSENFKHTGTLTGALTTAEQGFLTQGAVLEFGPASGAERKWATFSSLLGDRSEAGPVGSAGPVTLSALIPAGWVVKRMISAYNSTIGGGVASEIRDRVQTPVGFQLVYSVSLAAYQLIELAASATADQIVVAKVNYVSNAAWRVTANGQRFIFESLKKVHWYNDGRRALDAETGVEKRDIIRILKVNEDLHSSAGASLGKHYELAVDKLYRNRDGSADPKRVTVLLNDDDLDGTSDQPDLFGLVVGAGVNLFWKITTDGNVPFYDVAMYTNAAARLSETTPKVLNAVAFDRDTKTFWVRAKLPTTGDGDANKGWVIQRVGNYAYGLGRGPNMAKTLDNVAVVPQDALAFQWKHYASTEHRIDPSRTNIHDLFVLTSEYDYLTRLWIRAGSKPEELPAPPSEIDLRLAFEEFEEYRMFSDQIVWRPVKYKFLFGNGASDELRAQFKVVKVQGTTLSDGEISSQIIRAINTYFDVNRWDFGQTFYYTELAAFIHQQLATVVASVVIVPLFSDANFGDGFEVRARSDEIFISTAQVADVVIINSNTATNLRIR